MTVKNFTRYVVPMFFLAAVAGCASRPDAELSAVEEALTLAERAEASVYAESEYQSAGQTLEEAKTEIAAQDGTFVLSRDYSRALDLIAQAQTRADAAASAAAMNKQETIREVEALIEETAASIEMTRTALSQAPTGKDSAADLAAMNTDLDRLTAGLESARTLVDRDDYIGAKDSLTETQQGIAAVADQILAARNRVAGVRTSS